jgi:tRNA pseudouridine38-40 synthase
MPEVPWPLEVLGRREGEVPLNEPEHLVRLRLDLGYDGTDFSGWAAQPGRRTVAGVLVEHVSRVVGVPAESLGLVVAGRTDAGVHAIGQVCHLDVPPRAWARLGPGPALVRRLAGLLPADVRVREIGEAPTAFDARFSATFRRYEYRATDAPWGAPPLRHRDTLAWPRPLDLDALNAAATGLIGEHDFAAYCKRKEHATTVRQVTRLDFRRDPDGIVVATVQADAFCQAMVRSLMGALLVAGDARRAVEWPAGLLARRERANEVVVVPPHGLTLVEVGYPAPEEYAARAEQTRRLRG